MMFFRKTSLMRTRNLPRTAAIVMLPCLMLLPTALQAETTVVGEPGTRQIQLGATVVYHSLDADKVGVRSQAKTTPGYTTIFFDDIEGAFPGDWSVSDQNPDSGLDFWDDVNCAAYNGSWSAWCADDGDSAACTTYDDDMDSWMVYGPFSLADADAARAEFYVWASLEECCDEFFWGASTDGTNFSGGYLRSDTGWAKAELDLDNLAGHSNVWFAVSFESDFAIAYEGVYIDDILIEKHTNSGSSCNDSLSNGVACLFNDRFEFTMTWTDFSSNTLPVVFTKDSHQAALGRFQNNVNDITIVTKVTNGCSFNGNYWLWLGAFTGGGYNLSVRDTVTGATQTYSKAVGGIANTIKDVSSFPCN